MGAPLHGDHRAGVERKKSGFLRINVPALGAHWAIKAGRRECGSGDRERDYGKINPIFREKHVPCPSNFCNFIVLNCPTRFPAMTYRSSPMIRRIVLSAALSLLPCLAQGQEQPISVYFDPLKGGEFARLNQAIQEALSQPPLRLEAKPSPQTIVISAPAKVEVVRKKVSGIFYGFTLEFSRDRSSLGQSQQNCGDDTLSECTDQIVLDVKTVAAPR
jgi:hypothetical protein